jgi:hypothetical protein
LTSAKRRARDYLSIIAYIIQACPETRTNLAWKSGLVYTTFVGPQYLQLLVKQGLLTSEIGVAGRFDRQKNTTIYYSTPKGELYLRLMKTAKDLLGIGD